MNETAVMQDCKDKQTVVLKEWIISEEKDLKEWAQYLVHHIDRSSVLLMEGPMGSGKTTMVRHIMEALEGEDATSPTFSLVNEYIYPEGRVYHFDLYRIEREEELEDIGFGEYLDREALCIIEWPSRGTYYYQDMNVTTLRIEVMRDESRKIQWIKGVV
ncbi:tRNA (adenosine(37)-N6)-threonylcarbamoyltransferase complex ATPase subunit type 1 TsaE [Membranicola marinus]|uniref:tRNA threonylcarbamoyladenosine biosynthesis protein TsaE n=1 Tax=Membranihabitans marinus TaxID=1227546 RepID=A0A953L6F9_9BACT|nr:tRNA (adenosine(37)-N6)-threonylcarbamoyltransferase complex ATPase subunit type 1 TsaE [Membranihabitans marinus]MBY5957597.1 tRNA (adenosine(37)-N6)-threonylcarbamoyltransferase complex ATPase subunit type 1 TsaE [Membranihabitans marinus]